MKRFEVCHQIVNANNINLDCQEDDNQRTSRSSSSCEYEGGGAAIDKDKESDIDDIDFANFKGIYIDEDPNRKF